MKEKIINIQDFELYKKENCFYFEGEMRFSDDILLLNIRNSLIKEYKNNKGLALDFTKLTACNSTNIQNLNKAFMTLSEMNKKSKIKIYGNYSITWQKRGLNNFPLVWTDIEVSFTDNV